MVHVELVHTVKLLIITLFVRVRLILQEIHLLDVFQGVS